MATIDTQTRKVGDTLRLSGELTSDTMPTADADWVGAVAVVTIVSSAGATYRSNDPSGLDVATVPRRYVYEGTPPVLADIGTYYYEVEVTFADTTITTFPNNADRFRLVIVAELG